MTDKERLEEIKRNIVGIFDMESGRIESVDIRKEDYEWLIEQADRGVEYDRYLISLEDNKHYVTGLEKQNKRYREALLDVRETLNTSLSMDVESYESVEIIE